MLNEKRFQPWLFLSLMGEKSVTVTFHIFLCFPPETDLLKAKIQDFATLTNNQKILGYYCMSKGDFPHLSF